MRRNHPNAARIRIVSKNTPPVLEAAYTLQGASAVRGDLTRKSAELSTGEIYYIWYEDDLGIILDDVWIVLNGNKAEIEKNITDMPAVMLHAEDIYSVLDRVPDDRDLILTFSMMAPKNTVICESPSYKYMREAQAAIVADLYGIRTERVIMLPDWVPEA